MSRRTALALGGAAVIALVVGLIAVVLVGSGDDGPPGIEATAPSTSEATRPAPPTTRGATSAGPEAAPTSEVPTTLSGPAPSRPATDSTSAPPPTPAPGTSAPPPTTPPSRSLADVRVHFTEVARLTAPVDMAVRAGDPALYVIQKTGQLVALTRAGTVTVVDIGSEVSGGNEQGLLGIAFSPDGGRLYLHYTDRSGDTALDEWQIDADRAVSSRRRILSVDQPYSNHNGGAIAFGPDGLLYIALGDGGSGGDPDGNAQDLSTVLGKILRIDPRPSGSDTYRIPADNPFAGQSGTRGEIWSYGLRNPWRISFDREKGDLWIGDVGQSAVEEVNWAPQPDRGRGANFGWDRMEGNQSFEGSPPHNHAAPIHTYPRSGGRCAITGGYVYRGARIPNLGGAYLFADFCAGEVMALRPASSGDPEVASLRISTSNLASFAEGLDGALYALSLDGPVLRIDPD